VVVQQQHLWTCVEGWMSVKWRLRR
jgi:hypothetical protein